MKLTEVRALIADDARVTRRELRRSLERLGITIIGEAQDGVEAVKECLRLRPELLITELVLPRLSGADVVRVVQARHPLPVIIVTAHCDKTLHTRCLALGACALFIKPVSPDELGQVVSRVIGGRAVDQGNARLA